MPKRLRIKCVIAWITEHEKAKKPTNVRYLTYMGWAKDKNGNVLTGYASRYVYRFYTHNELKRMNVQPFIFDSRRNAMHTLCDIDLPNGGLLSLMPINGRILFSDIVSKKKGGK